MLYRLVARMAVCTFWCLMACAMAGAVSPAHAWNHDQNQDRIDDRIARVNLVGWHAAFVNEDPGQRMEIAVFSDQPLRFGVYIGYDHRPASAELTSLAALGLNAIHPYECIDYVRSEATFDQIQSIAQLPGITRIEAIPMVYATNHYGSRVVRARDSGGLQRSQNYVLFPSARTNMGLDGTGVSVAILDTGVNDAPDGNTSYPGHESLLGKFLGGGSFYLGDPLLNTPLDSSENPSDHGSEASSYHATHVAGTIMGTGGQDGFYAGVAPAARLIDCKVLSDAGAGFGSIDGVDWCIHNRNNTWGLTGADTVYAGIDILSMSLGGATSSDGTDASSQAVNAAVLAGLVVCIATGNDDSQNYIASPSAADLVISVGASSHASTLVRSDDTVTSFSNEGPRLDDGDTDHLDEMKPDVVAPGDGILSADGDFVSDGGSYRSLSGTSMATPHVSGVCALLLQAKPDLTPLEMRSILRNTAEHNVVSVKGDRPNDPFGLDSNYDPGCGWGLVDVYAAAKELITPVDRVQVTQFRPLARPDDGAVDVTWITQREYPSLGFRIYRAEDVDNTPGEFALVSGPVTIPSSVNADPVIEGDDNRTPYVFVDQDPALTLGRVYWYQVRWVDLSDAEHSVPYAPVAYGEVPRVATAFYQIVHNAVDHDLQIRVGSSRFYDPANPEYYTFAPSTADQDSSAIIEPANAGTATVGYDEHFWSIGFGEGDGVGQYLPPAFGQAWFLDVVEGGYVNRLGRITAFSMFVNDSPGSPSGTTYITDSTLPEVTAEGQRSTVWIPEGNPAGVETARLSLESEANGLRLVFELGDAGSTVNARIARGENPDFDQRIELTREPIRVQGGRLEFLDTNLEPGHSYWYWVLFPSRGGDTAVSGPVRGSFAAGELSRSGLRIVGAQPILQGAAIRFVVGADAVADGRAPVELVLHDLVGRVVRRFVSEDRAIGRYDVVWDGRDELGHALARGAYFLRYRAGGITSTEKVTVLGL